MNIFKNRTKLSTIILASMHPPKIMKTILRKNTPVLAKRIPVLPMNILVMLRNLVTTNLHQAA